MLDDGIFHSTDIGTVFSVTNNDSNNVKWNYSLSVNTSSSTQGDRVQFDYTPEGTISSTGDGEEFMPPYITVYCWRRTA